MSTRDDETLDAILDDTWRAERNWVGEPNVVTAGRARGDALTESETPR